jgi:hypothetical protein
MDELTQGLEICALLGYNAASSGNPLPDVSGQHIVPSSRSGV